MAIENTKCTPPAEKAGDPGQGAAVARAGGIGAAVGLSFAILVLLGTGANPAGFGLAAAAFLLFGLLAMSGSFLNWWLEGRLLCLDGARDHFAVGVVWTVEPPQEKSGFEAFDDDFSLNLLLSPAAPGEPLAVFPSQGVLVQAHPAIVEAGLANFGYEVTAARLTADLACTDSPTGTMPRMASLEWEGDPGELPGAGKDLWEAYEGGKLAAKDGGDAWEAAEGTTLAEVKLPDTQLLHCEFEGTTIANLRKWMPFIIIISFVLAAVAAAAIAAALIALGVGIALAAVLAVLAFLALLALLIFLGALLVSHFSHQGDPGDAADPGDTRAGDPQPIPEGRLGTCEAWDSTFDLIGVTGLWVYDFGHTRGWNEIHPVRHVQFLSDAKIEMQRVIDKLDPIRPKTDSEGAALRDRFADGVTTAQGQALRAAQGEEGNQWAYHPEIG
jgi:hypothetical protein